VVPYTTSGWHGTRRPWKWLHPPNPTTTSPRSTRVFMHIESPNTNTNRQVPLPDTKACLLQMPDTVACNPTTTLWRVNPANNPPSRRETPKTPAMHCAKRPVQMTCRREAEAATCQLNARSRVQKPTVTDAPRCQHTQHNPSTRSRLDRPPASGQQYSRRRVCRGFQYLCAHVAHQDVLHCGCTHAKLQQITHPSCGELGRSNANVVSQSPAPLTRELHALTVTPESNKDACARELIIIAAHDQH
jgi:hypothetical protein